MKASAPVLLLIIFSFMGHLVTAQPNLVPNYSFEDNVSFCNGVPGNLWDPAVSDWNTVVVTGSTPDLYRPCMSNNMQIPANIAGSQWPSDGESYAGILGTHSFYSFPNGREYIQVPLSSALVVGIPYRIQYKTSLAENSNGATPMGMALGSSPFIFSGYSAYQAVTPLPAFVPAGASYSTPNAITDKLAWTTVSFDYTPADPNIQYLMIGNIDNTTAPVPVSGTGLAGSPGPGAYYYIDEVQVYRLNPAAAPEQEQPAFPLSISPNPSNGNFLLSFPFQSTYEIEVYDCFGRRVFQTKGKSKSQESIEAEHWSGGVYYLRMSAGTNTVTQQKLVLLH